MPNCVQYSKTILFADVATIYISSNNIDNNIFFFNMFYYLNVDLADLAHWFKAKKLSLNINKSNYLLFLSSEVLQSGGEKNVFVQICRTNN